MEECGVLFLQAVLRGGASLAASIADSAPECLAIKAQGTRQVRGATIRPSPSIHHHHQQQQIYSTSRGLNMVRPKSWCGPRFGQAQTAASTPDYRKKWSSVYPACTLLATSHLPLSHDVGVITGHLYGLFVQGHLHSGSSLWLSASPHTPHIEGRVARVMPSSLPTGWQPLAPTAAMPSGSAAAVNLYKLRP